MKVSTTKRILLPIIFSALALGACSQQVKPNTTAGVTNGSGQGSGQGKDGAQTGTINNGNGSGVSSRETRGGGRRGGAGDRANFNYLPGNRVNNDPNNTTDLTLAGLKDPNNLLSQRVIYFDYDRSDIRPEYMVLINTHAQLAAKFPQLRMRLEGHADERGSREYNVALSALRAQSVKRIMGTQGARASQIRTVGYGEEIPLVTGHNKRSWQKNRRVEIKYDNY